MHAAALAFTYLGLSFVVTLLLARWLEAGALAPAKRPTLGEHLVGETTRGPVSSESYAEGVADPGELLA